MAHILKGVIMIAVTITVCRTILSGCNCSCGCG